MIKTGNSKVTERTGVLVDGDYPREENVYRVYVGNDLVFPNADALNLKYRLAISHHLIYRWKNSRHDMWYESEETLTTTIESTMPVFIETRKEAGWDNADAFDEETWPDPRGDMDPRFSIGNALSVMLPASAQKAYGDAYRWTDDLWIQSNGKCGKPQEGGSVFLTEKGRFESTYHFGTDTHTVEDRNKVYCYTPGLYTKNRIAKYFDHVNNLVRTDTSDIRILNRMDADPDAAWQHLFGYAGTNYNLHPQCYQVSAYPMSRLAYPDDELYSLSRYVPTDTMDGEAVSDIAFYHFFNGRIMSFHYVGGSDSNLTRYIMDMSYAITDNNNPSYNTFDEWLADVTTPGHDPKPPTS